MRQNSAMRVVTFALLGLLVMPALNGHGGTGGQVSAMKSDWVGGDDNRHWFSQWYNENARDSMNAYTSKAADLAKGAARAAKQAGQDAKNYYEAYTKPALTDFAEAAAEAGGAAAEKAKNCATTASETAKDVAAAAAAAAKDAADAAADIAAAASAAAKDAATASSMAASKAATTAGKAAGRAKEAAKEAAKAAHNYGKDVVDDMSDMSVDKFKEQVKLSMKTLQNEFAGDGDDSVPNQHSKTKRREDATPPPASQQQQQQRRCPYTSRKQLETAFADQAVHVLKATDCDALSERKKSMYAGLLNSGTASCEDLGIYELLDELNGKLPARKVALCAE